MLIKTEPGRLTTGHSTSKKNRVATPPHLTYCGEDEQEVLLSLSPDDHKSGGFSTIIICYLNTRVYYIYSVGFFLKTRFSLSTSNVICFKNFFFATSIEACANSEISLTAYFIHYAFAGRFFESNKITLHELIFFSFFFICMNL